MLYFTSDTHFYGDAIVSREMRPFMNAASYTEYQINVWNSQAGKDDDILHLGDFCNYHQDVIEEEQDWEKGLKVVGQVNANVHLVIGNNEERVIKYKFNNDFEEFKKYCIELGFKGVHKDMFLTLNDKKFYLNHYPRNHKDGYINLFGHLHKITGLWKPYGINVGTDLNNFRLYSEEDIETLLQRKEIWWENDIDVHCM